MAQVLLPHGSMTTKFKAYFSTIFILCLAALLFAPLQAKAMQVTFMGRLANFEGIIPSLWSKIALDKERTEVITLNPRQRDVRVFNEAGMEIYAFGDNIELAGATDLDLDEQGNIYLVFPRAQNQQLLKLDYKGDYLEAFALKDIPADYLPFNPEHLQYLDGMIYLADSGSMDVIVTDTSGNFQKGYRLKEALRQVEDEFSGLEGEDVFNDPKRFENLDMTGFYVDHDTNIYFTISVLFSAFKLPAQGELRIFGSSGSGPGKFGVVAGITTDTQGNIYVTDRLRSVVMIFDSSFSFITEFGFRGTRPGNLIVPDDVIVDEKKGYIYVAQAANRGVSFFKLITD
ncbi:MAG: hypothetical protein KQH63_17775 [Desulfobulbaceae bacterium]|nr:hypothetical protein [Desulfobulbaceae bacterium]